MTRPFEPEDGHPGVCTAADGRATAEAAASSRPARDAGRWRIALRCSRPRWPRSAPRPEARPGIRRPGLRRPPRWSCRDWISRRCGSSSTAGERAGGCGRRRRDGPGWTSIQHAYQCLPLVVANQWGWQVLCPTDVRVTWDGSPGLGGLTRRGRPPVRPGDQEPVRLGDRDVLAPLAVPHPARLGPLRQGAEQPLEAQLRTRSRASSRPGGSTTRSRSTGSSSSPGPSSSPGARASASSSRSRTRRSRRPRRSRPRSACSSRRPPSELLEWQDRRRSSPARR